MHLLRKINFLLIDYIEICYAYAPYLLGFFFLIENTWTDMK